VAEPKKRVLVPTQLRDCSFHPAFRRTANSHTGCSRPQGQTIRNARLQDDLRYKHPHPLTPDSGARRRGVLHSLFSGLDDVQRNGLVALAESNHVVVRAFVVIAANTSTSPELSDWVNRIVGGEKFRIRNALTHLRHVCNELEANGCAVAVMKSLDHWPDLGSDLDLYTTADEGQVKRVMLGHLGGTRRATQLGRSTSKQMEFLCARVARVSGSACSAFRTDWRAHGARAPLCDASDGDNRRWPDIPGSCCGRAADHRNFATYVPALFTSASATS